MYPAGVLQNIRVEKMLNILKFSLCRMYTHRLLARIYNLFCYQKTMGVEEK